MSSRVGECVVFYRVSHYMVIFSNLVGKPSNPYLDQLIFYGCLLEWCLLCCCCCSVTKSSLTLVSPWTATHQAFPSFTISQSLLKLMSTESVMLSNHLILCCPLLLLPSIFPSTRVFSWDQSVQSLSLVRLFVTP